MRVTADTEAPAVERRLTAILSADVKDYSRLMAEDEAATVQTITAYREFMVGLIGESRGRVVDASGDNLLAEFSSVVDAVECAASLQAELARRNTELAEARRMEFRIGINMGDVVVQEERIYGDDVNIAARIQALADPGGICVSDSVYEHVHAKVTFEFESLGEHMVKNIVKPVHVYRLCIPDGDSRRIDGALTVASATGTRTIAVMPFHNRDADDQEDAFVDGLTEDIITDLARDPDLNVIPRATVFAYKGTPVKLQDVSRETGARYVLEGSARRAGDRLRVTAQLVDISSGAHLWAERYDRTLEDVFDVQDELVEKIVSALRSTLGAASPTPAP
jgi:adenylate cyclase